MSPRCLHLGRLVTYSMPQLGTHVPVFREGFATYLMYVRSCHSNSQNSTVKKNKPNWNRTISDAEKIVGYPNLFMSLQSLPSDDILSIVGELRKLVGTNHPLLKIAKRLIYNGRNNMHTRGLIVLLAAKIAGKPLHTDKLPDTSNRDDSDSADIMTSQRNLAEITEMIHTARLIHKGVVNLKGLTLDDGKNFKDMEYGNKIAILVGDYLLANASLRLGTLNNTEVVGLMALAIRNFVEGEFVFEQDQHGTAYPLSSTTLHDWEVRTYLCSASLLSNSCRSAMLLANHNEAIQTKAFEFGKNLGLTWQAFIDLQPYTEEDHQAPGAAIDLTSSPMILHLQQHPRILDQILPHRDNLEAVDYKKIKSILVAGNAINEAKQLGKKYAEETIRILNEFPPSEARDALQNIIYAME